MDLQRHDPIAMTLEHMIEVHRTARKIARDLGSHAPTLHSVDFQLLSLCLLTCDPYDLSIPAPPARVHDQAHRLKLFYGPPDVLLGRLSHGFPPSVRVGQCRPPTS